MGYSKLEVFLKKVRAVFLPKVPNKTIETPPAIKARVLISTNSIHASSMREYRPRIDLFQPKLDKVVLVEEENLIRWKWKKDADRIPNFPFMSYATAEDFLQDLHLFTEKTKFFLDQDMYKTRAQGLILAKSIRKNPATANAYICLVTGYSKSDFIEEINDGILNEVCGKYPFPFKEPDADDIRQFHRLGFKMNFSGGEPPKPKHIRIKSEKKLNSFDEIPSLT